MIDKMTRYSFVLLSGKAEEFLSRIQALGLVDITRSSKPVDENSTALFSKGDALRKACDQLEKLDFSKDPDLDKIEASVDPDAKFEDPLESYKDYSSRRVALAKELELSRKEVEETRAWGRFDKEALEELTKAGCKVRFYCLLKKKYDPSWAELYPLQEVFDNGSKVWFVTVSDDPDYSLPADECTPPEGDLTFAERKVEAIKEKLISCKARLLELKEYAPSMRSEYEKVTSELQLYLADAGSGKAADDMITTFTGFAPSDKDSTLCEEFDKMDMVYVKEIASREDNPPIKLKENKFASMYTVLTDMYGRPVYDEFDPTPFLSIFFTLFFAICLGDAGYGLLLIIIGWFLKKGSGSIAKAAPLVMTLGAATIIMGLVLHTLFGMDLYSATWVPAWMKKGMIAGSIGGYDAQMLFAIIIGVVHISLAILLKTIYAIKREGFLNSLGNVGWALLIIGGVIVGASALMGVIDAAATKWIVIVLGSISALGIFLLNDLHRNPLANIGMGLYETYNTATGLLGDVLSYLRLYALGLAGGMLGNAFNSLGTMVLGLDVPVVNIIGCVLIILLGHTLNLAMCCLGAFVHPLRLNFLEFFKNSGYEGTGRAYSPLVAQGQSENE